ncbi:FecR domain-containing protein [Methylophaga sp.]|uniref:FecR domain-containing protein n=1 Tax=Methylophaga sp. TaxID=2024840 RepID=UPI0027165776|nr:FecR domain-containing protein [Methylophaga sp.]MDO8825842.1 FecR domain-containing protein [Methylophaga sp.]
MKNRLFKKLVLALFPLAMLFPTAIFAQNAGVVKTMLGNVQLDRAGELINLALGDEVYIADKLQTQNNSSVGILFSDDTRIGAGPDTSFSIDDYQYDSKTQLGRADLSVKNGTLAVVGGKLAAKDPQSVKVHTPTSTLTATCSTLSVKVDPLIKEAP